MVARPKGVYRVPNERPCANRVLNPLDCSRQWFGIEAQMKFGVFDHMDNSGVSLGQQIEERLRLIEAYDRGGFHAYHLAEHMAPHSGLRRRRTCSWRRSRSAPS